MDTIPYLNSIGRVNESDSEYASLNAVVCCKTLPCWFDYLSFLFLHIAKGIFQLQCYHSLYLSMKTSHHYNLMQKAPQNQKLLQAKISPIEWPKVQPYIEDVVINLVQQAAQQQGDNQYQASKEIKVKLEHIFKGNWTVIICPADQKTYNIHYTPALAPESKYETLSFIFEYLSRRYLIFKGA